MVRKSLYNMENHKSFFTSWRDKNPLYSYGDEFFKHHQISCSFRINKTKTLWQKIHLSIVSGKKTEIMLIHLPHIILIVIPKTDIYGTIFHHLFPFEIKGEYTYHTLMYCSWNYFLTLGKYIQDKLMFTFSLSTFLNTTPLKIND